MFTKFPTVLTPMPGAFWDAGRANTATWLPGSPSAGAANFLAIWGSTGKIVYPTGNKLLELSIDSTSHIVPPNWTSRPGIYYLGVGIGTSGTETVGRRGCQSPTQLRAQVYSINVLPKVASAPVPWLALVRVCA